MGEADEIVAAAANKRRGYLSHITRLTNESNALTSQPISQDNLDVLSSHLAKLSSNFEEYISAHKSLVSELIEHKPDDEDEFKKYEERHANVCETYRSSREELQAWLTEAQESLQRSRELQPSGAAPPGRRLSLHVSEVGLSDVETRESLKLEGQEGVETVSSVVSSKVQESDSSVQDRELKELLMVRAAIAKAGRDKQLAEKRQSIARKKLELERKEMESRMKQKEREMELLLEEERLQMEEKEDQAKSELLRRMDETEGLSEKSFMEVAKWVDGKLGSKEEEESPREVRTVEREVTFAKPTPVPVSQHPVFKPNPDAPAFTPASETYCVPPDVAYQPYFSTPISPRQESADASVIAAAVTAHLTLPRPELLVFRGDPSEYPSFISNFKMHIGSQSIAPRHKLSYLLQFCQGDAKEAIKECVVLPEEEGFEEALKILNEEFGKPHKIVKSYVKALTEGPVLSISDTKGLVELARKMRSCQLALRQESYLNLSSEDILSKIARRLPMPLRVKWVEKATRIAEMGKHPKYDDLHKFIKERASISSSEFADILKDQRDQKKDFKKKEEKRGLLEKKTTLAISTREEATPVSAASGRSYSSSQSRRKCVDCGGSHWLVACEEFRKKSV